ncbi:hypothetical protein [Sphingomonas sp.]|uniref:hypothetical protein n=1 Tax=Sphingomonas sp. TaxID=28214 RepID=UPI00286E9E08|nr:hypothetical protein [Sphingomonas sp.]
MRWWGKAVIAAAAMTLTGCLWGPGKFTSDLSLRKDGGFTLAYRGEIVLQSADAMGGDPNPEPWSDAMARCRADGSAETVADKAPATDSEGASPVRPCTAAEIAKLKGAYVASAAEKLAAKRKQSEEMAKMFGLPGADDESNRKFAATMMRYRGWRSVVYKGKGVFEVDYRIDGRVDQDFAFPLLPDTDLVIPFIQIRQRSDGTVLVTAPGLAGGKGPFAARAKAMGMPGPGDGPPSRAQGRLTVRTAGEVLTNNSEDGPAADPLGRRIVWDIGPASDRSPEMLVRL